MELQRQWRKRGGRRNTGAELTGPGGQSGLATEEEGGAKRGRWERPWVAARARSVPSTRGNVVDTDMLLYTGGGYGGPQVSPFQVFEL